MSVMAVCGYLALQLMPGQLVPAGAEAQACGYLARSFSVFMVALGLVQLAWPTLSSGRFQRAAAWPPLLTAGLALLVSAGSSNLLDLAFVGALAGACIELFLRLRLAVD